MLLTPVVTYCYKTVVSLQNLRINNKGGVCIKYNSQMSYLLIIIV